MYLEFKIFCPDESKELVQAELMYSGFEGLWESNDYLCAYIPEENLDLSALKVILERYGLIESYSFKTIENINWNQEWESSFEPISIGDMCQIRAEFHPSNHCQYDIVITPKMSFGTGHHETTYMMAEQLLNLDCTGKKVLDMGCGTAVLAILAEMRGASEILAIDNEDWAIENAQENILNNNCKNITVLNADAQFDGKFDIILSNINRNINLEMLEKYALAINPSGIIFLSGFYNHDVNDFEQALKNHTLQLVDVFEKNQWACLKIQSTL